jgi:hypothetical protein
MKYFNDIVEDYHLNLSTFEKIIHLILLFIRGIPIELLIHQKVLKLKFNCAGVCEY